MTYPQPLHQNHLVNYYKVLHMSSRGKHPQTRYSHCVDIIFTSNGSKIECLYHRLTLKALGRGGDDALGLEHSLISIYRLNNRKMQIKISNIL